MKSRMVAVLAVFAISVAMLAGCSSNNSGKGDTSDAAASEPGGTGAEKQNGAGELVPITFVRQQDTTVESNIFAKMEGATYEDNVWTDLIEERLGYDVQYLWIASNDELYKQKFNAAIASGEMPDISSVDKIDLKRLVESELLVDLGPYIEEYGSDYLKELILAAGDAATKACTIDGVQYGLPFFECDLETAQMLWLRQDWMVELGLEAPKTLDDLKDILRAFKEHAGEGSTGLALSSDLYGNQFDIKGWSNAYGAYPEYWIEDGSGNLVYGSTTPEMKEALGSLAELYEEGLVNPEFFVNDTQKANETLVNGKCGAMYGFHATSLDFLQSVVNADPNADWMPYMIPMSEEGETITPGIHLCTTRWFVVSKECTNPEALIEMMNLYCEKTMDPELNEYEVYANPGGGIEGVWKLAPVNTNSPDKNQVIAKAIEEPLKTGNPEGLMAEQYSMWEYTYAAMNGDKTLWSWELVFGENGGQQLLISYQNDSNVEFVYDKFLGVPGEVMTAKKTTLDDMLRQTFVKIISGQEELDAFDDVVEKWKNAGGQDMTDEVNEWYDSEK